MEKNALELIACPYCKGKLHYDKKNQELICRFDKLAFPIQDGIPIMLIEKARMLNIEELEKSKS